MAGILGGRGRGWEVRGCGPGIQSSGEEEAGSPGEEKEDTQREKRSRRSRRGASWKKILLK